MSIEFKPWPKTARLYRDITITEKIDGTNAAIGIVPIEELAEDEQDLRDAWRDGRMENVLAVVDGHAVYAQSRNRLITPGKSTDNAGFAAWVQENSERLVPILGKGLHFGEWWGRGIQRNYGLDHRRFSLFNQDKWADIDASWLDGRQVEALAVVPLMYQGPFEESEIQRAAYWLRRHGSIAAAGFKAEGIVVFHTASRTGYKVLLEHDDLPKSLLSTVGAGAV